MREIWLAYFTHLSLGWVFSASWLNCLWDHRSPFVRTNKFISRPVTGFIQMVMAELALGSDLLTTEILLTVADFAIGPAAAGLICVSRFAIIGIWHQMRHTFQLSCQVRGPVKNRGDIRGPARSDAACEVF